MTRKIDFAMELWGVLLRFVPGMDSRDVFEVLRYTETELERWYATMNSAPPED